MEETNTNPQPEYVVPFSISIAEHIDSVGLPIVEFTCGGKELSFIIDSGSNGCHINKSVVEELNLATYIHQKKEGVVELVSTGNGLAKAATERCEITLSLEGYDFNVDFSVDSLDSAFDFIKETDGVQLHGILGTNFLRANNWTIDFANNAVYPTFEVKKKDN